jgi:HEPN domain-containing protein
MRGMRPTKEVLLKLAGEDFDLAGKYRNAGELLTASFLYNKAIELALRAMFIGKNSRTPPTAASIKYLAEKTVLPEDIIEGIQSLEEEGAEIQEEEQEEEMSERGMESFAETEYAKVMSKELIAERLMNYAEANE